MFYTLSSYRCTDTQTDTHTEVELYYIDISIESTNDMNQTFGNYHSEIFRIYNVAFPSAVCSPKNRHPVPWMTSKLKQCIRKKARLCEMFFKRQHFMR